jgi:hypothetical protein
MNAEQQLRNRALLVTLTGERQRAELLHFLEGEEPQYYEDLLTKLDTEWQATPENNAPSGRDAIAHLHYTRGTEEFWIVEKGATADRCCWGITATDDGVTLCYFQLKELLEVDADLDLYFTPVTVGEILGRCVA